jgi:hypothetical protein
VNDGRESLRGVRHWGAAPWLQGGAAPGC